MDASEIIGELREFKRATLDELKELKKDVKALNKIHWKAAGGTATLIVLFTIAVQVFATWFQH